MSLLSAYRITHLDYKTTAFTGEGARIYGGRWNEKGTPAVYLSNHPALAVLEVLVHLNDTSALSNFCMFELSLPEGQIFVLDEESLPDDWSEHPPPSSTVNVGQEWLASGVSLAMRVPSTTIKYRSYNYIVNVNHELFADTLATMSEIPLKLDSRLLN